MRTCITWASLGLLLACFPADHSLWVADRPLALGIIATVVEPGGYSSDLVVPEDRARASPLPLDTFELERHVVIPPGVELPPPVWIVCHNSCTYTLSETPDLAPCPVPLPLSTGAACRLGEGERLRVSLGGAYTANADFWGVFLVMAVSGADSDMSSETCLERMAVRPFASLERCLVQTRLLRIGPLWKALLTVPALESQDHELPESVRDEEPDFHPVLLGFDIVRQSGPDRVEVFAREGDDVPVRPGERLTLTPRFSPDASQSYHANYWFGSGGMGLSEEQVTEILSFRLVFSEYVGDYDPFDRRDSRSWIAPDTDEPVVMDLYALDSRQGRVRASLRFVPDAS